MITVLFKRVSGSFMPTPPPGKPLTPRRLPLSPGDSSQIKKLDEKIKKYTTLCDKGAAWFSYLDAGEDTVQAGGVARLKQRCIQVLAKFRENPFVRYEDATLSLDSSPQRAVDLSFSGGGEVPSSLLSPLSSDQVEIVGVSSHKESRRALRELVEFLEILNGGELRRERDLLDISVISALPDLDRSYEGSSHKYAGVLRIYENNIEALSRKCDELHMQLTSKVNDLLGADAFGTVQSACAKIKRCEDVRAEPFFHNGFFLGYSYSV